MTRLRQGSGGQARDRQGSGGRACAIHDSGAIELFYYDELDAAERNRIATHVRSCRECVVALEELQVIREALAQRPDVAGPAGGDWSGFMARLDSAVRTPPEQNMAAPLLTGVAHFPQRAPAVRSYIGLLATAALLAIVTIGVVFVARQRSAAPVLNDTLASTAPVVDAVPTATTGLRSAGARHFERSKLVVLGLADRQSAEASPSNWAYERELATSLLNDTRLYRIAAEERGLNGLASMMRDLELVLLETSMAEESDAEALGQIQKLIRKRGLIQKMDTVASAGMMP